MTNDKHKEWDMSYETKASSSHVAVPVVTGNATQKGHDPRVTFPACEQWVRAHGGP